jgi:TetR/AcrR family transcriptional regulator of autoinduction and epiphytic fitness
MSARHSGEAGSGPSTDAPSYHQRIKGEKRQAAVEAALRVFSEQGYGRASLLEIARHAGLSTATLFKRFPTKASLFEAMILECWKFDVEPGEPLQEGDPSVGLRRIGYQYSMLLQAPKNIAFYRMFIAEAEQFPELGRLVLERGKLPYVKRVSEYLHSALNIDDLALFDETVAARQFLAIITDQLFWPVLLVPGFSVSFEDARKAVEEAVSTIMARYRR